MLTLNITAWQRQLHRTNIPNREMKVTQAKAVKSSSLQTTVNILIRKFPENFVYKARLSCSTRLWVYKLLLKPGTRKAQAYILSARPEMLLFTRTYSMKVKFYLSRQVATHSDGPTEYKIKA